MSKPRALDLFCKAGGVTKGLQRAGFYVVGVDVEPQPRYCGDEFFRGDALVFPLEGFDLICASCPCHPHTALKYRTGKVYECFIERTRARLVEWGGPYVIENVVGAPLLNPVRLCGSSFGLGVRRHRLFESNLTTLHSLPCNHATQPEPIDVSGTGARRLGARTDGKGGNSRKPRNLEEAR